MNNFTLPQLFYQNSRSFVGTQRDFRTIHGHHSAPSVLAISRIIEKFESGFSLHDNKPPNRRCSGRSKENMAAVR